MHSTKNVGRKRLGRITIVGGSGSSNLVHDRKRSCQIENRTSNDSNQPSVSPGVGNEDLSFSASFACDLESNLDLMSALDKMEKNYKADKPSSTRSACISKDQTKTRVSLKNENYIGPGNARATNSIHNGKENLHTPKHQMDFSSKENKCIRSKTIKQRKRSVSKSPAFLPDDGVWTSPLGMSTPQNSDPRKSLRNSLNSSRRKSSSCQRKSIGKISGAQKQMSTSRNVKTPVSVTSRVTRSSAKKNTSRIQKDKAILPGLDKNTDTPIRGNIGNKNNRSDFFKSLFIENTSLDDIALPETDLIKQTACTETNRKVAVVPNDDGDNLRSNISKPGEEKISRASIGHDSSSSEKNPRVMLNGNKKKQARQPEGTRNHTTEEKKSGVEERNEDVNDGNKGNIQIQTGAAENMLALSSWGLPEPVLKQYHQRGITHMFDWQTECLLQGNVLGGGNLVYSAPTSAGKTMVAELLVLKRVLETRKKAIFILPFVSVSREKMFYLQELYQDAGIRVSGFMGSYAPAGGFSSVDVAVCTIEKGNGIINRCLEENRLDKIGIIVVDELHLIGDPHRGYLLELLLTKVNYMVKKSQQQTAQQDVAPISIQIVGMSATLPNVDLLAGWLNADLYRTDYRPVPLTECVKIGTALYDNNMALIRDIDTTYNVKGDPDHVVPLCIETIRGGHSILIFCPTKNWCEKLAETVARELYNLLRDPSVAIASVSGTTDTEGVLVIPLDRSAVRDVVEQLKRTPVGVDNVLGRTVPFGVAYHHAGLTFDERDIVEGAFRQGILKVLIATSTLSSGVNLPARRVLVRTPVFHGGQLIDFLTYKQMIGRAGRKGVDTEGESILLCKPSERSKAAQLLGGALPPVQSALIKNQGEELSSSMKRAILEVVVSGVAMAPSDVAVYASCTLLAASLPADSGQTEKLIDQCIKFLQENEFVCMQKVTDNKGVECDRFVPTQLGAAVLASSLSPDEGLVVFSELQRARRCFVLENELHIIYQVTPIYAQGIGDSIDWYTYFCMWEALSPGMKKVAELAGVKESFLARAVQGRVPTKTIAQLQLLRIHKRFYTALALHDLVQEMPLNAVTKKYNCNKGQLQSLQQSAATFAGMVTVFCARLGWSNLELILSQFQNRLTFGVQRELCDLVRISSLNGQRARVMFNGGYQTVAALASAHPADVEALLKNSAPFQSMKRQDKESDWEVQERCRARCIFLTGRKGVTEFEAASIIIDEAKSIIQEELGGLGIQWKNGDTTVNNTSPQRIKSPVLTSPVPVVGHRNLSLLGKRRSKSLDKNRKSPRTEADKRPSVQCVISPPPPTKQARMVSATSMAIGNQSKSVSKSNQSKTVTESNQSNTESSANNQSKTDLASEQSKTDLARNQSESAAKCNKSKSDAVSNKSKLAVKCDHSEGDLESNFSRAVTENNQSMTARYSKATYVAADTEMCLNHIGNRLHSSKVLTTETDCKGFKRGMSEDTMSCNSSKGIAKPSSAKTITLNNPKSEQKANYDDCGAPAKIKCSEIKHAFIQENDSGTYNDNAVKETQPEKTQKKTIIKDSSVSTVNTETHIHETTGTESRQLTKGQLIGNKDMPNLDGSLKPSVSKVCDKKSPNVFSGGAGDLDDDFADSFMIDTQTAIDIIKNTKKSAARNQNSVKDNVNCNIVETDKRLLIQGQISEKDEKKVSSNGHERKFSEDLMDIFENNTFVDKQDVEDIVCNMETAISDKNDNVNLQKDIGKVSEDLTDMIESDTCVEKQTVENIECSLRTSIDKHGQQSLPKDHADVKSTSKSKTESFSFENDSLLDLVVENTQVNEVDNNNKSNNGPAIESPCELSLDSAASLCNELDANIGNRSDVDMFERSDELIAASNYEHLGLSGEEGSHILVNESYQDLHIPYQSGQEKCFEKTDTEKSGQEQLRPAAVNNIGLNCLSVMKTGDKPKLGQFSSQKLNKGVNYSKLNEDMAIALEMGESFTSTFNSSAVGIENKKQDTDHNQTDGTAPCNNADDNIGDSLTFSMMEGMLDGTQVQMSKSKSDIQKSNIKEKFCKLSITKDSSSPNVSEVSHQNYFKQSESSNTSYKGVEVKQTSVKQNYGKDANVFQNDSISTSVLNSLEDETFVTPVKAPCKRLRNTPISRKQKIQKTENDTRNIGEDTGVNSVEMKDKRADMNQGTSPLGLNTSGGSDCVPPTPPGEGSTIESPRGQGTPKRTPMCSLRSTFSPRLKASISVGKYNKGTLTNKTSKQLDTVQLKKKNTQTEKSNKQSERTKTKKSVRRNIENETIKECNSSNRVGTGAPENNSDTVPDQDKDTEDDIPDNVNIAELDEIVTDDDKLSPSFIDPDESGLPLTQASFTIIDVCADKRLFKTFVLEWRTKTRYAISLACERKQQQPTTGGIGANFRKDNSPSKQAAEIGGIPLDSDGLMIVGLAVSWENRDAYYVSFSHDMPQGDPDDTLAPPPSDNEISISIRLKAVKSVLQQAVCKGDPVTMVMFDFKTHFRAFAEGCGFAPIGKFDDPKIACWMLDPGAREKNLHRMVTNLLPTEVHMLEGIGGGIGVSSLGMSPQNPGSGRYRATTECVLVRHLGEYFRKCLEKEGLYSTYTDVEMPSAVTLCRMELNGFGFSQEESEYQKNIMIAKLSALEQQAYTLAGHPFSLSATEDVAQVLFVELLLPPNGDPSSGPVTRSLAPNMRSGVKKGRQRNTYSTSKDILEKLSKLHPLPGVILEWRRITNALTKVVFPLQKEKILCERLSMYRIFCDCQLHTATGRVSLSEPNLQNVPKDFDITMPDLIGESPSPKASTSRKSRGGSSRLRQMIGPQQVAMVTDEAGGTKFSVSMRHAFIPFHGGVLLAADYSQLELRMIAYLSGDQKLIHVLNEDGDVFKLITAQWKNIKPEDVSAEERAQAKQVCYGMIYGIGPKALGEQIGVDENDAAVFIETFKAKYPGMRTYLRKTVETCREKGYVQTTTGRKRYLQHITATNPHARAQAERQAVNTTVQGSAADLVKQATIKIDQKLTETFPMTIYCHRHKLNSRQAGSLSSPPQGAFLVLQLHDELIYEVSQPHVAQVAAIVKQSMENAVKLPVKMPVKVKVGPSWGKLEDYEC